MIWILAFVATVNLVAPDVTINKVGIFTEEQKCEDTRRALQENAEPGNLYICIKHTKDK